MNKYKKALEEIRDLILDSCSPAVSDGNTIDEIIISVREDYSWANFVIEKILEISYNSTKGLWIEEYKDGVKKKRRN